MKNLFVEKIGIGDIDENKISKELREDLLVHGVRTYEDKVLSEHIFSLDVVEVFPLSYMAEKHESEFEKILKECHANACAYFRLRSF